MMMFLKLMGSNVSGQLCCVSYEAVNCFHEITCSCWHIITHFWVSVCTCPFNVRSGASVSVFIKIYSHLHLIVSGHVVRVHKLMNEILEEFRDFCSTR